jgi:hypothetical protein
MTAAAHPLITAIAFAGHRAIARGPLDQVALAVRDWHAQHPDSNVLVFDAGQGGSLIWICAALMRRFLRA